MASPNARHFCLDPEFAFLNHGSFGACPRAVLDEQLRLREQLERQPLTFYLRRYHELLDDARAALAAFVGADPEDLVAVRNATSAVNAVIRSLELSPGDELLVTDHAYGACKNACDFVAGRWGARVVVARLPFPVEEPAQVVEAIVAQAGERTRLVMVSHVTSPTGMVLPIADIVRALGERGIDVLVDGAHAVGMLELSLRELGAAYYTSNCHKWLCAPKGAAFLYVRPDRHGHVRPLTISHGAARRRPGRSQLHDEFDWTGTDDPTAFLCVPFAIGHLRQMVPGGWAGIRAYNRALVLEGRALLARTLGVSPPCPESMIGSLAVVQLPPGPAELPTAAPFLDPLQEALYHQYRIEVPVVPWPDAPSRLVRISAQLYNDIGDYERLARALGELL